MMNPKTSFSVVSLSGLCVLLNINVGLGGCIGDCPGHDVTCNYGATLNFRSATAVALPPGQYHLRVVADQEVIETDCLFAVDSKITCTSIDGESSGLRFVEANGEMGAFYLSFRRNVKNNWMIPKQFDVEIAFGGSTFTSHHQPIVRHFDEHKSCGYCEEINPIEVQLPLPVTAM